MNGYYTDLRDYGYAPGDYAGRKCHTCRETLTDCDKRAWRCKPCAERLQAEDRANAEQAALAANNGP